MTEETRHYASSPTTQAIDPMDFPYHDITTSLVAACDKKSQWAYIHFNEAPNLRNDETESGYNVIITNIKWNTNIERTRLTQTWGENALHFTKDEKAINNLKNNKTALLQLEWHGQGTPLFQYSLNGSTAAIQSILNKCANLK